MSVNLEILTRPLPNSAIKTRKGGGNKDLRYVEGHTVIHRLNEATGNNWSLSILDISERTLGKQTLLTARVALTLPGLGSREAIGVQLVSDNGGEDLAKGCITDGLKKAATLFGVGLELYGPDYESAPAAPPQHPTQPRNGQAGATAPDAVAEARLAFYAECEAQALDYRTNGKPDKNKLMQIIREKSLGWRSDNPPSSAAEWDDLTATLIGLRVDATGLDDPFAEEK